MLCKMSSGALVKIRVDMLSDRPHACTNYRLQGADGCYESARAHGERDRIWLRGRCKDVNTWLYLDERSDEFLPDSWKKNMELTLPGLISQQSIAQGSAWLPVPDSRSW